MRKILLVGDGAVGSTIAYTILQQELVEKLAIVDINKEKLEGDVMDLEDARWFSSDVAVYEGDYSDARDADIVLITAGISQTAGKDRNASMSQALDIIKGIVDSVVSAGFKGIFLVVSNPVDILTYAVWKYSGFPAEKVIGTGTSLDTARLRVELARSFSVNPQSIDVYMLGEHGDSEFVAFEGATIGGQQLKKYAEGQGMTTQDLLAIQDKVKTKAYGIIKRKHGTFYGIASCAVRVCRAILSNEDVVLPVSTMVSGEYGQKDIFLGTPAVINCLGITKVIEVSLSEDEKAQMTKSAEIITNSINSNFKK